MATFEEYDQYDGLGLAKLVQSGVVDPLALLEEAIARTEELNPHVNGLIHALYDEAREAIRIGLPQGPFHGVPFLLKDLHTPMKDTPCQNGSAMWRNSRSASDNTLVKRYRDAGLVIYGKTNTPEMGLNPVTEPREFGPSRNPWNLNKTPGGSSGGAAALVAAGALPIAHASDGGGSIRIPAACCGLFGLKPSRGRLPQGPEQSEAWAGQSTSHVLSRSVRDSAAMLDTTAGNENGEAYSAPAHAGTFLLAASTTPNSLRVAVSREKWGRGRYQRDVLAGLEKTVELLQALGHQVQEARPAFDGEEASRACFTIICVSTALAAMQRAAQLDVDVDRLPMEEGTRLTVEMGRSTSATDYQAAVQFNHRLGHIMGRFHQHYDVTLAPTLASAPVPVGHISEATPQQYGERLFSYMGDTTIYNQTGQPSMSLPLHWNDDGLPIGMMFSAAYGNDALLLQLAGQLEQAAPWRDRRPPVWSGH